MIKNLSNKWQKVTLWETDKHFNTVKAHKKYAKIQYLKINNNQNQNPRTFREELNQERRVRAPDVL